MITKLTLMLLLTTKKIYGAAILFAVGNRLVWSSVMSILSKRAGTDHQGAVQGVASSFGGLTSIVGLIVGGRKCAGVV
jgi:hypothetical protein